MAVLAPEQYLIFDVSNQQCATPIGDVSEVILMAQLSKPVGLPSEVVGMLNLGGEAIPVLNLSLLLGLEDREADLYSHILLAKTPNGPVGFLSHAVKRVVTVSKEVLKPMSAQSSFRGYALAMMPDGKNFIAILSLRAIAASCVEKEIPLLTPPSSHIIRNLLDKAS